MLSIKNSHGWVLIDNSMDEIYDNEEFQKLIANFGAAYQALQNTDIDHPFIKGIVRLIDWYYNHFLNDEDHAQIIFNPIYKNNGDGLEFEDVTIYSDEVDEFIWGIDNDTKEYLKEMEKAIESKRREERLKQYEAEDRKKRGGLFFHPAIGFISLD